MKIVIVGPGAIGCLFAALLKAGGQDVLLLDKSKERASYIKRNGIRVSGLTNLKTKVKATQDQRKISRSELVIFTVKSYDLEKAARRIKKSAHGKNIFFMGLQNGLGNIEILSRLFGKERVIASVTNHGSTLIETGCVRHAGKGITYVGSLWKSELPILKKIKTIFEQCGIDTEIRRDIDTLIWNKLMVNVGINAITAICHIKNGQILKIKEARKLMTLLVEEASLVAKGLNIKLPLATAVKQTENICRKTANNISSMLQDIQKGKKTEIDFINGAIVKKGKARGLPVPFNEAVTYLVKTIENTK
jgi:2-dehydropantoate 2-reductase